MPQDRLSCGELAWHPVGHFSAARCGWPTVVMREDLSWCEGELHTSEARLARPVFALEGGTFF
jgi:hypothetical protein